MGPTSLSSRNRWAALKRNSLFLFSSVVTVGRLEAVAAAERTKVRMSDFMAVAPLARRRCEPPSLEKAVWRRKRGKRSDNYFWGPLEFRERMPRRLNAYLRETGERGWP